MIFWIREDDRGDWSWRLYSTKAQQNIAASLLLCRSESKCLEQIALIKSGIPEATIRKDPQPKG
jgi:hypothetical protein